MKNDGWPTFSFTDVLRPADGWKVDHAILTTYSADLVVIVTALMALSGCDLEHRRTGSRVELVKAIEALRGRVRVLAQAGRVTIPSTPRPILKLLDKFLRAVETDENKSSWHPKVALVRYRRIEDATDCQWRVWLGSRNLTRPTNWEAGLTMVSRTDGRGRRVDGLATLGKALAARANLKELPANNVGAELATLTWECPPGCEIQKVEFLGPQLSKGFPRPPSDTERVFVVSPFLDPETVRAAAAWGTVKTRRTLVSTALELQCLSRDEDNIFTGFDNVLTQPPPDLPGESVEFLDEEIVTPNAAESEESEELSPAGLHAKIFFAAKGSRRQLWLGSANATRRGWEGINFEVVAELSIGRDAAEDIEGFVAACEKFVPNSTPPETDKDEEAVEYARKLLCGRWSLQQRVSEREIEVIASAPPPLEDIAVRLEVAVLGGTWSAWPLHANSIVFSDLLQWQRCDFLQIRVSCGKRMLKWLQVAPCQPEPDEDRDRALITQYLDPRTFLMWVRSLLADEPARAGGGDWDAEAPAPAGLGINDQNISDVGLTPTVEEILRAWVRDPSAFISADQRVTSYLVELERRAKENGAASDSELLGAFRRTWNTLASELR